MATRRMVRTKKFSTPFHYQGNLFFLILFLFIFFPIGILLLLKNTHIVAESSQFHLAYHGSWGWLFFWGLLFFPIAIILFLVKGVDIIEERDNYHARDL